MARPRGGSRRRFVLALVVLTSLTLITLDTRSARSGPLGSVGRAAHTVLSPVERLTSSVTGTIGDWWSGMVDSGHLKRENRALHEEVSKLRGERHNWQIAIDENRALSDFFKLHLLNSAQAIAARVIDRDPGNFDSTITIDRGSEAGIEKDMAVMAADGAVGLVLSSWHGGAQVRVLTDPDSAIAVRTINNPAIGIAQGQAGSRSLVVSDFDASVHINKGDAVVSGDLSTSDFPPDLPVGTVTSVSKQQAGLGLVVHVAPYADFDSLDFVEVLRWVPGEGPVVTTTTTTTTTTTIVPGSSGSSETTSTSTPTTTPNT